MADLAAVLAGAQAAVATVAGLRAHDVWPGRINPPAAVVIPVSAGIEQTFTAYYHRLAVVVVSGSAQSDFEGAQHALHAYMATTGTTSVLAALLADQTLGGVVACLLLDGWTEPGVMEINGAQYWGARLPFEAHE